MVKFLSFGGEIAIPRDQIATILRSAEGVADGASTSPGETKPLRETKKAEGERKEQASLKEEQGKEEKEYQKKLEQVTRELRAARDRYLLLSRGRPGAEPAILDTEEARKARTEDLISRLRDVQHRSGVPADAGGVRLETPSPFTGVGPDTIQLNPSAPPPSVNPPPPSYSEQERELSELRGRIARLERERDQLIQEMKQKNFDTGALFID